jgi:hypothetical protein
MNRIHKFLAKIGFLIVFSLLALNGPNLNAQEATAEAQASETPAAGENAETQETVEAPTVVIAQEASPTPASLEPSQAAIVPEPPFGLLVREMFDNGDLSPWTLSSSWTIVTSENGQALQVLNSSTAIELQKGAFYNVAVQARFLSDSGAARLSIRQSEAGQYSAVLNPNGTVALYRGELLLTTTNIVASYPSAWRVLRISAVDTRIRVSVDNFEVLAFEDSTSLPAGTISIGAIFNEANATNTMLVDDFMLWVPSDELGNYPTPTPYLLPTSVPETATPALSEAPVVESSPSASPVVAIGKDYSLFPVASAEEIVQAEGQLQSTLDADHFPGIAISSLPYFVNDNTIADTLEANEELSTCAYGLANTVWFHFTAPATASYRISTVGSSFDTILAIYTGSDFTNLAEVACNDDASSSNLSSQLNLNLNAGTTYYIQMGGFNGRYGSYTLGLQQLGIAAPTVPTLLNPVNGAKINDTTPTLSWNSALNVYQYEVQWSTSATFAANVHSALVNEPSTSTSLPALADSAGMLYYWRVRAINGSGIASAFSAVFNFTLDTTAPTSPVLSLPANAAVSTNSRPTLSWAAVSGATKYRLDLSLSSDFSSFVSENVEVTTPSYTPSTGLSQAIYYWRVQSLDAAGNVGQESEVRNFTVKIFGMPANNTVIFTSTGTANAALTWTAVSGATGYTLQIAKNEADFSTPAELVVNMNLGVVTSYNATALGTGIYYWRIFPLGAESAASIYQKFTISPAALAAPSLNNPSNAAKTNDTTPTLSWLAVANASAYEVQWSTSSTFVSAVQSQMVTAPSTSLDVSALADSAGTIYYWRLRSLNEFQVPGSFSTARSFTLDTIAPTAPALSLPTNAAVSTNSRPALSWAAVTGATKYRLDLSLSSDFSSIVAENIEVTTTSYTPATPLTQAIYYWRVQALDAADNLGQESAPRSFTLKILGTPANNTVIFSSTGSANAALTWTAVSGATGYTLQINKGAADFSNPNTLNLNLGVVTSYNANALSAGVYYWRVFPLGAVPSATIYQQFTISPAALIAPSLNNPANAAKTNDTTPTLSWLALANASSYEVQWSTSSTFASNLHSQTVTAPTTSLDLLALPVTTSTIYYWRVRGLNEFQVSGAFSTTRSFTLDTTAPTAPTLSLPANAAISTNSRPALSWAAVTGATKYRLDLSLSSDFSNFVVENVEVTTTSFTPAMSLAQAVYYWRVQALDAAGNLGQESTPRIFTVKILGNPANNAVFFTSTGSANATLTWTAVSGSTGYTLQINKGAADFSNPNTLNLNLGIVTSYNATALATGVYYWRVFPLGAAPAATIYQQFTLSPTALAAPTLSSPANAAKTNDMTPTLSWLALANASSYEVQWSTSATFASGVQSLTASGTTLDLPALPATASTVYYWRVRGLNEFQVSGAFSTARSFTLDTSAPTMPSLSTPPDNSSTTSNPVTYRWLGVTGASGYELRYGTSNPPTVVVANLSTTSYTPPSTLLTQDYFWQVRALDAAGNASDWSVIRTLKLSSATTAAPLPNSFTTNTPTLFWTPVNWSSAGGFYLLQIDNQNTFASPEYLSWNIPADTAWLVTDSLTTGVWYWRVRACSARDVCGAWSATGSFTIEAE